MPLTQAKCSSESISCIYSRTGSDQLLSGGDVLALVDFNGRADQPCHHGLLHSGLLALQSPPSVEVWYSGLPVQRGEQQNCQWSANDELLFAGLAIDEGRYPSQREAIHQAYRQLLQLTTERDYPHLIRVWNYMPDINRGEGEQERYKQFCLGRLDAFDGLGYQLQHYPSACALGNSGGNTVIYLLASKTAGVHFENPHQVSAYRYPSQYGPASPSFARATLANWSGGRQLYISGTASIVGHQSRHGDALDKQLQATCHNIDALLQHVGSRTGSARPLRMSMLKVYLRQPEHLAKAQAAIRQHFGSNTPALYLRADICRSELLVEVDGLCNLD